MTQWKARPTVYNGIAMRSRLEARFASWLDQDVDPSAAWEYEPRAYGSVEGQYLPDFQVHGWHRPLFVEVKPTEEAAWAATARIRPLFASEPTAMVFVVWPDEGEWAALGVTAKGVSKVDERLPA